MLSEGTEVAGLIKYFCAVVDSVVAFTSIKRLWIMVIIQDTLSAVYLLRIVHLRYDASMHHVLNAVETYDQFCLVSILWRP
jgi:hypothetical protein